MVERAKGCEVTLRCPFLVIFWLRSNECCPWGLTIDCSVRKMGMGLVQLTAWGADQQWSRCWSSHVMALISLCFSPSRADSCPSFHLQCMDIKPFRSSCGAIVPVLSWDSLYGGMGFCIWQHAGSWVEIPSWLNVVFLCGARMSRVGLICRVLLDRAELIISSQHFRCGLGSCSTARTSSSCCVQQPLLCDCTSF